MVLAPACSYCGTKFESRHGNWSIFLWIFSISAISQWIRNVHTKKLKLCRGTFLWVISKCHLENSRFIPHWLLITFQRRITSIIICVMILVEGSYCMLYRTHQTHEKHICTTKPHKVKVSISKSPFHSDEYMSKYKIHKMIMCVPHTYVYVVTHTIFSLVISHVSETAILCCDTFPSPVNKTNLRATFHGKLINRN